MQDPDARGGPQLPLVRRLAAYRFTSAQLLAIDVVAVAVITVVFELFMSRMSRPSPKVSGTAWETVRWAAYLVAAMATLARRRLPRSALAVVLAVAVPALCLRAGGGFIFLVVLALYSVVAVSPRRASLVIVSLVASAVLAAILVGGGDEVVQVAIGGVTLILLGWLAGENVRAGRVYAGQQADRAAEQAAAVTAERAEQVHRALADERAQIARELHDIVAHAMSVIAVRSGVARMVIDSDPGQAREALAIIETTTRRSLQEMRLLVGVLRADDDHNAELRPVPGLGDLDRLVTDTAVAGVAVDVDIEGTVRALPAAADLSAYRIVQEALTNVVRHAGPTHAQVKISYRPDEVSIEVVDDGPRNGQGPPALISRSGDGHGLIGMRERAALFGGELAAGPRAAGFCVTASLRTSDFYAGDFDVGDVHASPVAAGHAMPVRPAEPASIVPARDGAK
jgi:signal transduction histidine kinase